MLREALRQGGRGPQHDTRLMVSPWDFHPEEIRIHVELWHGEDDRNAPPAMARYVAGAIPDSQLQLFPGEGHISLIVGRIEFGILRYMLK